MSIGPKTPYRRKNLADISYRDRVIAQFASNFVAMATEVGRGKCDWQHSIVHPRKPTYRRKNLADISCTRRVIANFVSNFVAIATGVGWGKCDWQRSMAHPQKPPYRRKNLPICPKFHCHDNGGRLRKNAVGSIRWPIPESPP